MAGSLTLWGAGEIIQTYFSRAKVPPPSFYLALIRSTPPTPYMSGAEIDEPVDPSYSRVEIPNDIGFWQSDIQPQLVLTQQDTAFPAATEDWGTIRYWALCDAPHEGNNFFVGSLEVTQSVSAGDTALVGAGDLAVSLGPFFAEGS